MASVPSHVISRSRRWMDGIWFKAPDYTSRWSAAVLRPADPMRSLTARLSPVLSHQTVNEWWPQVRVASS